MHIKIIKTMQKKLTKLQAYNAMMKLFIKFYDLDSSGDIGAIQFLQDQARLAREKNKVDSQLWQNWLQCVDEALSVKDSRYYLKILPK